MVQCATQLSLYTPRRLSARARNSRDTCELARITLIWLVGIQICRESTAWKQCTRNLLPVVSVLPSLSFFVLSLQCRWPPPVGPRSATGAPLVVVWLYEMLFGRPWAGFDKEEVAVTVELEMLVVRLIWRWVTGNGEKEREGEGKKAGRSSLAGQTLESLDYGRREGYVNSPISLRSCYYVPMQNGHQGQAG